MRIWPASLFIVMVSCVSYSTYSAKSGEWKDVQRVKQPSFGIGYFALANGGRRYSKFDSAFSDALAFASREAGVGVTDYSETKRLLIQTELPSDRFLTSTELLQLAGNYPAPFYLQGYIEEITLPDSLDTRIQVMAALTVHEMKSGQRLLEVRVYVDRLEARVPSVNLEIARELCKELIANFVPYSK